MLADERACEAVQRLVLRFVGRTLHDDGAVSSDAHVFVERAADLAFGPFTVILCPSICAVTPLATAQLPADP